MKATCTHHPKEFGFNVFDSHLFKVGKEYDVIDGVVYAPTYFPPRSMGLCALNDCVGESCFSEVKYD